jgi:hypothetical protein
MNSGLKNGEYYSILHRLTAQIFTAEIEKEPEIVHPLVLETLRKLGPFVYNPKYEK